MVRRRDVMRRRAAPLSMTGIGRLLQIGRVKRGLQQKDVAMRAGLRRERLSKIEAGLIDPRWSDITKIAHALEVELPELFEESSTGTG